MPDPIAVTSAALAIASAGLGVWWYGRARRAEARLAVLVAELRIQRHAAEHDPLTDLPNRRAFFQRGGALVAEPAGRPATVVLLDLDNFKHINDRHGHAAGDHVLATIARRLASYARDNSDARDNLVARLGGDEFAALFLGSSSSTSQPYPAIPLLADLVAEPITFDGHRLAVTASIGLAELDGTTSLVQALHRADLAMYQAKGSTSGTSTHTVDRQSCVEEGGPAPCQLQPSIPVIAPSRTSPPPTHIYRPTRSGSTGAARGDREWSRRLQDAPPQ
jgi:diguanylate cyclase (GGDEF)-like protein